MLLAGLLSLSAVLSGCGSKPVSVPDSTAADVPASVEAPEKIAPGKPVKKKSMHEKEPAAPVEVSDPENFSQPAAASLAALRRQMTDAGEPYVHFAVAYLGYVGGLFDEGFDVGFPSWLAVSAPNQLEANPFLAEIDPAHIVGGVGHLYCIVPQDENASLAVSRVHWDMETLAYVVDEVEYRMESGEPILLFANLDSSADADDTAVTVISENGQRCEWHPMRNEDGTVRLPGEGVGDRLLDFTQYRDVGTGKFGDRLINGWLGPTALGLAGSAGMGGQMWSVEAMARDGRFACFTLTFYPGDETGGQADLNWSYEGQTDGYEEMWSGWWTLEAAADQPSYVTLDLTRVGGASYETSDSPVYLSETYPMMVAPSGESLLIAAGQNGIPLPFMADSTELIELLLAVG